MGGKEATLKLFLALVSGRDTTGEQNKRGCHKPPRRYIFALNNDLYNT